MKALKNLTLPHIGAAWLYFYIHLVTEVVCFYCLTKQTGDSLLLWFLPLAYDALAFVPQSLVGALADRYPRLDLGSIGAGSMALAALLFWLLPGMPPYVALTVLCFGNACTHVSGAEVTLRASNGKLSHSAIFVSGGSFGVILGRLLAGTWTPYWMIALLCLTMIPFIRLAAYDRRAADRMSSVPCKAFQYQSTHISPRLVILLMVGVVIVRGYMGYGIPTSWKKTVLQSVILYFMMGVGKALGGLLADAYGVRKTAVASAALAVPFLIFGDQHMLVSLIGVMFFSMTMSVTLAVLVSVLPEKPGVAFGLTTIGLFLGTVPIFFFRWTTVFANSMVILILTGLSLLAMFAAIRKDGKIDG